MSTVVLKSLLRFLGCEHNIVHHSMTYLILRRSTVGVPGFDFLAEVSKRTRTAQYSSTGSQPEGNGQQSRIPLVVLGEIEGALPLTRAVDSIGRSVPSG